MTDLLPCPFCGSGPQLLSEEGLHVVMCTHYHCQAATLALRTEKGAIENWNTRAQPEYLSGCLHPSEFGCQFYGKCLSVACNHYGKTECRPRMTVLAQVDGIVYPKVGT